MTVSPLSLSRRRDRQSSAVVAFALIALLGGAGALLPVAGATELLTNGDFEAPLIEGWTTESSGYGVLFDRATTYEPDLDYEVKVAKATGTGFARLSQTVELPGLDAVLSADLSVSATATVTAWAAAVLAIEYLDETGHRLGETYIGDLSRYCPWVSGDALHLIEVDPSVWATHSLTLDEELANLPAVDPFAVRAVRVSLLAYVEDC